jgi:hypothetical protein|tara:strand:- start:434 stop:601 length:168 start_codon:yes stop_codon:yes gene_type:complete
LLGAQFFKEPSAWFEVIGIGLSLADYAMAVRSGTSNQDPVAAFAAADNSSRKGIR